MSRRGNSLNGGNALSGQKDLLLRLTELSDHLRKLEELRVGQEPNRVRLIAEVGGRTHVWHAPGGAFEPQATGGWTYRDELGRQWSRADHDLALRSLGRLPYAHTVVTPNHERQLSEIHYVRPPLERTGYDDRRLRLNRARKER